MLVLTRKKQEQIRIGDNITITVLRIKGKAVRLGIEAPQNQSVFRAELIDPNIQADLPPAEDPIGASTPKGAKARGSGAKAEPQAPPIRNELKRVVQNVPATAPLATTGPNRPARPVVAAGAMSSRPR